MSVGHDREPYKTDKTDRGTVLGVDSGGPWTQNPCVRGAWIIPTVRGTFGGSQVARPTRGRYFQRYSQTAAAMWPPATGIVTTSLIVTAVLNAQY